MDRQADEPPALRMAIILELLMCCLPLFAGPEQYEGRSVARIEFEPQQQPLSNQVLLGMLPLKPGAPLSAATDCAALSASTFKSASPIALNTNSWRGSGWLKS